MTKGNDGVMSTVLQDFRYALRQLRKSPGFTAVAFLTLALGIALNATMFSLVSAILLRRPPGRDPQRLAVISSANPGQVFLPDAVPASVPNYLAWRSASRSFSDIAAADEDRTVNLAEQGRPEVIRSASVSANYFGLLGVAPQLGRTFAPGEDFAGRDHVVVLSHGLWQRRFNGDASVLQRTMRLNRDDFKVIGVMPPDFRLLGFTPQLWTPLVFSEADRSPAARKIRSLRVFARLQPGVSLEEARAEMIALVHRTENEFPETEKGWGVSVRTMPDFLIHNFAVRSGLLVMMTAVAFVLVIACANVAGLLLTRAVGRQKEIGLRISLGADRLRIIRQLLCEGLLIALGGGSAGLLLAYWGIQFLRANLAFNEAISAVSLSLDRNVLLFTLAVSLASALLASLLPALKASNADVNSSLKDESRSASAGRSHSRLRSGLVTAEIAMSLFLLIGTGLLIRGVLLIEQQNLGFRTDHLLTAGLTLDRTQYKDPPQQTRFAQDLLSRLRHLPGVEMVAATSDLPATGAGSVGFRIKGQSELPAGQHFSALNFVVTENYFQTAGIALLRGRSFTERDNDSASPVVLVNDEFVRRHFQNQDPLGKQILLDPQSDASSSVPEWREIVGIVGNVKSYSEDDREEPQVYEPFLQRPARAFSLMIRTSVDPSSLAPSLRDSVSQIDAELPLAQVMSMSALIELQRGANPLFTKILGSFALLALILAAIGIYGLIGYSVGLRTREIGVRMALGARNFDVLKMILWEGLKTTALGAAIGFLIALPLPKAFAAMFYTIRFSEPVLYLLVPGVILIVALLATYIPARRASRIDPMVALRCE